MKSYPSIPNSTGQSFTEFDAHVFDKLDGQNFRAEWSRKQGWCKFGSRTQLVGETDEAFGPAIEHFRENLEGALTRIAREQRATRMLVFAEWHGPSSFAGMHTAGEDLTLSVLDATIDQKGWLSPQRFREVFEDRVPTPEYLGKVKWTRGYVQQVRDGLVPCTMEGVVGKQLQGPRLIMAKAKTQAWLEKIYEMYDPVTAARLAAS